MARLQRLKPITYQQLLELAGMTEAKPKEVREAFKLTSTQQSNYTAKKEYKRENVAVEAVLLGVLTGLIDKDKLAVLMLPEE